VENAFGIATSRFRVFRRPICANVETAVAATKAAVALHNFLMKGKSLQNSQYCPPDMIDQETGGIIRKGSWRTESFNQALQQVSNTSSNNYSLLAKEVRENFKAYFNSNEELVLWRNEMVQSTTNCFDVDC